MFITDEGGKYMKVNRITSTVCLIIIIVSGALLIYFKDCDTLQSLLIGIFTGFIVSFVVAVIGYFHERAKIIEAIDLNIRSLFLNITVMSKILGQVLPQIHSSVVIPELLFKDVSKLASLNSEFIKEMNLGLYNPFNKQSKKSNVCKKLEKFNSVIYTMKNLSSNLEIQVLNYDIALSEIQKNQMMGIQMNSVQQENLNELKNLINIKTAKFHEYVTAQSLEIAEIGKDFYGNKKKRKQFEWDDIEKDLLSQAEMIIKGR